MPIHGLLFTIEERPAGPHHEPTVLRPRLKLEPEFPHVTTAANAVEAHGVNGSSINCLIRNKGLGVNRVDLSHALVWWEYLAFIRHLIVALVHFICF